MTETESVTEHHMAPEEEHEEEYALFRQVMADLEGDVLIEGSYVHKQPRRLFFQVLPDKLRDVVQYFMTTHDMWQASTLSGRDLGDDLQANYHFFLNDQKIAITLRVNVPRNKPEYSSITDLMPAFEFVENELRELFGVIPVGHPKPRRCELPENWPKNEYPMRKDWADPRGLMQRSKTTGPKKPEEY
ncbi:MAG: hypothetical protein EAX81_07875 [Candidatus Thorarchaeota archaeon]|nr:hypothetical protein [Candidatus Thorarchaeota archaeon]